VVSGKVASQRFEPIARQCREIAKRDALLICARLRRATLAMSAGKPFGTRRPRKMGSAYAPRKLLIIS
jgi:hypothetical protein